MKTKPKFFKPVFPLVLFSTVIFLILFVCIQPPKSTYGQAAPAPTPTPVGCNLSDPSIGSVWSAATTNAVWAPRNNFGFLSFTPHGSREKLWVIGGAGTSEDFNDISFSENGINWSSPVTAPFTPRDGFSSIVFNGQMWVIGGSNGSSNNYKDVWSSADGKTWNQVLASGPFTAGFSTGVSFNGQMFIFNPDFSVSGNPDHVWSSPDGVNWADHSTTPFRTAFAPVYQVFDDGTGPKIWAIGVGGGDYGQVWNSADGANWTEINEDAAFAFRAAHATLVFDNKMWVIAGESNNNNDDVWYSCDGINWIEATNAALFPPRFGHSSTSSSRLTNFGGKMWTAGGVGNTNFLNDVWYSPGKKSSETFTITRSKIFDTSDMSKIDPFLQLLVKDPSAVNSYSSADIYFIAGSGKQAQIDVFIKTTGGIADLESILTRVVFVNGDMVGGQLKVIDIPKLQNDPAVIFVKPSLVAQPTLDVSRPEIKADQVSSITKLALDGTGVVVGDVDTGIDWTHQDFMSAPNQTRILELWDQTQSPVVGLGIPGPAGLGEVYSKSNINAAILAGNNFSMVAETDIAGNGHGTHVMGIEASSGLAPSAIPGGYRGIAPNSDIVFVKTNFSQTNVMAGVNYILDQATIVGEPGVANLSLGTDVGAHDGSDPWDQSIDNRLIAHPSDAIVIAAGNSASLKRHVIKSLPANSFFDLPILVASKKNVGVLGSPYTGSLISDIWFQQGGSYSTVRLSGAPAPSPPRIFVQFLTGTIGGASVNITLQGYGTDGQNGNEHIRLTIDFYGATGGTALLTLRVFTDSTFVGGEFDDWINVNGSNKGSVDGMFNTASITTTALRTVAIPGTSKRAFTVASYVTKDIPGICSSTDVIGVHSVFSSEGPERPHPGNGSYPGGNGGVLKPDIGAPGEIIASALSAQAVPECQATSDGKHQYLQGTSMAAPHVSGTVALMKEANPLLTFDQIKSVLGNTARRDNHTGGDIYIPVHDNAFGFGKVDALHSTTVVKPPVWQLSSLPVPLNTYISHVVLSPRFDIDHTIFVGTLGRGLWKSTNGGVSWAQINNSMPSASIGPTDNIYAIALQPNYNDANSNQVVFVSVLPFPYASGTAELLKSAGNGVSNSYVISSSGLPTPPFTGSHTNLVQSLAISPHYLTDSTIFAGLVGGGDGTTSLFKSTNGGNSWMGVGQNTAIFNVLSIATSPNYDNLGSDQRVLFGMSAGVSGLGYPVGTSFAIPNTPSGGIFGNVDNILNFDIAAANTPSNTTAIQTFIGGGWGSTVPGPFSSHNITSKNSTFGPPPLFNPPLTSIQNKPVTSYTSAMALSPQFFKDQDIFVGTFLNGSGNVGQGVVRSFDGGNIWDFVNNGFPTILIGANTFYPRINELAISNQYTSNGGIIFAATANGLYIDPPPGSGVASATQPMTFLPNPVKEYDWAFTSGVTISSSSINPSAGQTIVFSFNITNDVDDFYLEVVDSSGNRTLAKSLGPLSAGNHVMSWDGKDATGTLYSNGSYTASLVSYRKPTSYMPVDIPVIISSGTAGVTASTSTPTPPIIASPTFVSVSSNNGRLERHETPTPTPTATEIFSDTPTPTPTNIFTSTNTGFPQVTADTPTPTPPMTNSLQPTFTPTPQLNTLTITGAGANPNPFSHRSSTTISFNLSSASLVKVDISDKMAKILDTIVVTGQVGMNQVTWNGKSQTGQNTPPGQGNYTVTITANAGTASTQVSFSLGISN